MIGHKMKNVSFLSQLKITYFKFVQFDKINIIPIIGKM